MAKVNIPNFKLNNGKNIPALGYGTWLGLNDKMEFDMTDLPKLVDTLSYAIDIGYRHIDTAHLYRVEPEVGEVINKKIKEGVVKREDLFVTTKVWHHFHRESDVEVSVRASLRRMNLDYLDLVLMHWPMSITEDGVDEKIDYLETWRGFEAVLEKGLAKAIGVSNFNVDQLKRVLANCKVPPACNQIEVNLNLGLKDLVGFCQAHNIIVVAYSPFGTMVPSRSTPNSPEPKLNNPTMVAIANKHGKTVTQITLRYLYQRGIISIPKTVTKSRVVENASIFDFVLDENDIKTIAEFDNGFRTVRAVFWQDYTNYPFEKIDAKVEIPKALLKWKNGYKLNID
ncbi:aldo-keto reductase AKR2E4-like [Ostrinia nubilalis]|uniref:aldo-keto reductase AKR2E4-like n=1 Tax=Ostrinia nubilalis TaxID=29057 RepID=UPI0030822E4B